MLNRKWFRDVPVIDAQSAREWLGSLFDESMDYYDEELVDYIRKMAIDTSVYDRELHNALADAFDVGCPIPIDEEFFGNIVKLLVLYKNCKHESSNIKFEILAGHINELYRILQEYIDDWNLNGCDECPLDTLKCIW